MLAGHLAIEHRRAAGRFAAWSVSKASPAAANRLVDAARSRQRTVWRARAVTAGPATAGWPPAGRQAAGVPRALRDPGGRRPARDPPAYRPGPVPSQPNGQGRGTS